MTWVVVPFANSFAPGPKTFDIDLNQVTYTTDRTQTADLSDGYYFGHQTVVALKTSKFATAEDHRRAAERQVRRPGRHHEL